MICFKCKKPGSIRTDFPLLNKAKFKKKKKVCANWDDVDAIETKDGSDEEGPSLVCFMALLNEIINVNSNYYRFGDLDDDNLPSLELSNSFNDLYDDMTSLSSKNTEFKKKITILIKLNPLKQRKPNYNGD